MADGSITAVDSGSFKVSSLCFELILQKLGNLIYNIRKRLHYPSNNTELIPDSGFCPTALTYCLPITYGAKPALLHKAP